MVLSSQNGLMKCKSAVSDHDTTIMFDGFEDFTGFFIVHWLNESINQQQAIILLQILFTGCAFSLP